MPVTPLLDRFSASAERVEYGYLITGESGLDDARAALLATAPDSVTIAGAAVARLDSEAGVRETDALDVYEGTVVYGRGGEASTDGDSFQYEIGGQATHLSHGINVGADYYVKRAGDHKDYQGAINVQPDGTVAGVDIIVPTATFTLGRTIPSATFDGTYERTLALMVGKVNSDTFRGYPAGELLLTRISGNQPDTGEDVKLNFSYAVSANTSSAIDLGNRVSIADGKDGHDYLWVEYAELLDAAGIVVQKPVAAYVSRVYPRAAYSALGIS